MTTQLKSRIDVLGFRKHALVQYTANQNAPSFVTIKDNVFAVLHSSQSAADVIT